MYWNERGAIAAEAREARLREALAEWKRRGEALRAHGGLYEAEAFAEAEERLAALASTEEPRNE